jgi:tetratricopeptide (TPR) repeat protein
MANRDGQQGGPRGGQRSGGGRGKPHGRRPDTPGGARERDRRPASTAPVIDDEVTGRELDKSVRQELATLEGPVAGTVARHLVMAGRLMDEDPELAHRHTQHARSLAGRVALVREAAGYAAYNAGHFDVALNEFKTARRISGRAEFLAVMADCERGVGRPEKALELAGDDAAKQLPADARAELAIVTAGALRDLNRSAEALTALQKALPARAPQEQWVARLQYALGDVLAEVGRRDEAVSMFAAAEAGDLEGGLDAGQRVVELLET